MTAALFEELAEGSDPHALLLRAVQLRGTELDSLVSAAVVALGRARARVDPVAAELGVSARQLHRRVRDSVGYGPRCFSVCCASAELGVSARRWSSWRSMPATPIRPT